ncbi:roadblock/LC7 domain-containing protein [Stenotrophomonas sp. ATCM1_4]|uniref:Roadblock/LC7 domain-containing protein n=2 Tax=Stenotrophomonas capsici TaxID=3110230 RepID=A0ABU5V435_9GAMM|nr:MULTISPECIES: roadblock/LC7 domain-containing protein [unclassified Stenotrophomonas]MBD9536956.1 roadblock/LC7 domain-containing protein [Stenotrophomonas sp. STM01]MEA5667947.1 roadblock/LC7 domain-containing protein [Stenotrophomonas sp. MH1]TDB29440.1 roadblock/LC7 domain-containing protein [Stenotrophomonas sp. ATCM1_4]
MGEPRGVAVLEDWEVTAVDARLREFTESVDGVRAAVVASVDGFALAQSATQQSSGERLAAMTSAMLALASAVGRELSLGTMEVLMLEASEGKVLMQSIPLARGSLLLMAACGQRSVIGHVLWSARECGRKIQAELSSG